MLSWRTTSASALASGTRVLRPFVWTKTAAEILETLAAYCGLISDSGHQLTIFCLLTKLQDVYAAHRPGHRRATRAEPWSKRPLSRLCPLRPAAQSLQRADIRRRIANSLLFVADLGRQHPTSSSVCALVLTCDNIYTCSSTWIVQRMTHRARLVGRGSCRHVGAGRLQY